MQNFNSQLLVKASIKKQSNFLNFVKSFFKAAVYFLAVTISGLVLGALVLETIVYLTN
tara:strand:+ start:322 stop:495 length:174 start_codon:yes stop_codon:yes gene_type:complete